jgi:hypothetical protein
MAQCIEPTNFKIISSAMTIFVGEHQNISDMKSKIYLALLLWLLLSADIAQSQTFTRITDPTNPIVTDLDRSGGVSWIDIDNDNDLDLFVSNGNLTSQNNRLYINNGAGSFTSVATGSIVTDGGSSIGSTWGDYDNDGFPDCFVTNRNFFGNFLYRGNGTSNPIKQTGILPVTDIANSNMSSWVDIDNDGDLDLYVVNFQGDDFLYLNSGGTFTAQSISLQHDTTAFSIPGLWADYNNDLRPDLFVGNSGTQNDMLYTNNGNLNFSGTMLNDGRATLGGSWGDYDNDGDLDLFVANYLGQASILYNNSGAPSYTLTPVASSAVQVTGFTVGSAFGDVDNDGDLDLFIADDGGNERLFYNTGYPSYAFVQDASGQLNAGNLSFGCALGDYDNDGQLDIVVANRNAQNNFLFHNNGNTNSWVTIKLSGTHSNKSGIGAKIFVKANIGGQPIWQMQEVAAQTGYNAQNLWLHFGFGSATIIDSMLIRWPSGKVDTCARIPVNAMYTYVEAVSCVFCRSTPTVSITGSTDANLCVCPPVPTGSISLAVTGTGPFTWSVNGGPWAAFSTSFTITGLAPLTSYSVSVKDVCRNVATAAHSVYINEKLKLVHFTGSAKNPSNIICVDADGAAAHIAHHTSRSNPSQHDYVIDPCTGEMNAARAVLSEQMDLQIIPNPNSGSFRLMLPYLNADAVMLITDVQGRTLRNEVISRDRASIDMDLSNLSDGLYLIRITDGMDMYQVRWIKQ